MGHIFKKIAKIISNIIFYILLAIIILLVIYIVIVNVYKKQDKLGEIPINFYTILTQSMYPKIKAGDIIITYKNSDDLYKVNDVITFISQSAASEGITITHRIVKIKSIDNEIYYITKGDSNNADDQTPVSSNNVVGKVIIKIPKAGFIQQFLIGQFGWLVAIVLPCLGIIIYDLIKIFKKIIKIKNKNKVLTSSTATNSKTDLKNIENNKYVSNNLEKQMDDLYESIGIDTPEEKVEVLNASIPKETKKEEEDDTEIL